MIWPLLDKGNCKERAKARFALFTRFAGILGQYRNPALNEVVYYALHNVNFRGNGGCSGRYKFNIWRNWRMTPRPLRRPQRSQR